MTPEEVEHDLRELSAEFLAIQCVLMHLMDRLFRMGPVAAEAIRGAFDDAAGELEGVALKFGKTTLDTHEAVKALRVVENLRVGSIGDHDKPKGGV